MALSLKVEKIIRRPAPEVFDALKSGLLFMNCSANSTTMKIDFRVGGRYHIDFVSMKKSNYGEFLEIVPDKKIVFTWCQAPSPGQKPDTTVTIDLFSEGSSSTRLVLQHEGFKDQATCDAHMGGWTSGLGDMSAELESGRLRLVRRFTVPVDVLFTTLKNPENFFAHMGNLDKGHVDFKVGGHYDLPNDFGGVRGEFLEIVPSEKIKMSWLGGCGGPFKDSSVTLLIHKRDNGSALELIHEGLASKDAQQSHREGWEHVTHQMAELFENYS